MKKDNSQKLVYAAPLLKMLDDYGNYCTEVRKVPLGDNANAYLGKIGFDLEMQGRKQRKDRRGVLNWYDLKIHFLNGKYL